MKAAQQVAQGSPILEQPCLGSSLTTVVSLGVAALRCVYEFFNTPSAGRRAEFPFHGP